MNGPNPNPEPQTTILRLHKCIPDTAAPALPDETIPSRIASTAPVRGEENDNSNVAAPEQETLPATSITGACSGAYSDSSTNDGYVSEDINRTPVQDPALSAASYGDIPRPVGIQPIRQLNREVILVTVEKALRYTRKKIMETIWPPNPFLGDVTSASANIIHLKTTPVEEQREETQGCAYREASDRLDKAGRIDGMSM